MSSRIFTNTVFVSLSLSLFYSHSKTRYSTILLIVVSIFFPIQLNTLIALFISTLTTLDPFMLFFLWSMPFLWPIALLLFSILCLRNCCSGKVEEIINFITLRVFLARELTLPIVLLLSFFSPVTIAYFQRLSCPCSHLIPASAIESIVLYFWLPTMLPVSDIVLV